jgi:hypothetical protein
MESSGTAQIMEAICREVDKLCRPLLNHTPATAAHVRETSKQLIQPATVYLGKHWLNKSLANQLLAESSISSNLLSFLLWSLPCLPTSLLEDTWGAWPVVLLMLTNIAAAGATLAEEKSTRKAAVELLEQLQPAGDPTKPGKQQRLRSAVVGFQPTTDVCLCPLLDTHCMQLLPLLIAFKRKVQKTFTLSGDTNVKQPCFCKIYQTLPKHSIANIALQFIQAAIPSQRCQHLSMNLEHLTCHLSLFRLLL